MKATQNIGFLCLILIYFATGCSVKTKSYQEFLDDKPVAKSITTSEIQEDLTRTCSTESLDKHAIYLSKAFQKRVAEEKAYQEKLDEAGAKKYIDQIASFEGDCFLFTSWDNSPLFGDEWKYSYPELKNGLESVRIEKVETSPLLASEQKSKDFKAPENLFFLANNRYGINGGIACTNQKLDFSKAVVLTLDRRATKGLAPLVFKWEESKEIYHSPEPYN